MSSVDELDTDRRLMKNEEDGLLGYVETEVVCGEEYGWMELPDVDDVWDMSW